MKSSPDRRTWLLCVSRLLTGVLACFALPAAAAPMEDFTADTWARWQRDLPRPAIVVFSTTYCPTCPEVLASLAAATKQHGKRVKLIAVVMDGDSPDLTRHLAHFGVADRLFAFRGQETALRYSVDPRWRGVTPYVALFGATGTPSFTTGAPSPEQLRPLFAAR